MQIYRKGLKVQMLLFGVFGFMGIHVVLTHFYQETYPWLMYLGLIVLVVSFFIGLMIYRSKDQSVSVITPKEVKTIKYLMYGYFVIYLIRLLLTNRIEFNQDIVQIASGALLVLIALYGILVQYKIYQHK